MVYGKTKIPDPGTGKEVPVPKSAWKVIENHHEPIISKETFEKAQAIQIRHTKKSKFDKETTLLSGYVKCGNCRRNLTGSKRLHGHVLYSCAYSQGKEDTGCFAGKADDKMLEQIVLREIKEHLRQEISREEMWERVKRQREEKIEGYRAEKMKCEKRREEIKEENQRNYERYREGEMGREEFLKAREWLEKEKGKLERQEQEVEELICRENEGVARKNVSVGQMYECLGYGKLTREMLEKCVKVIYVYDDGKVEIKLK